MRLHGWKKACNCRRGVAHGDVLHGDVVAGPFNIEGVEFLLHGLDKPVGENGECSSLIVADTGDDVSVCGMGLTEAAVVDDVSEIGADMVSEDDDIVAISTELLNVVLQRQLTTVTSIPHKCRLAFSRTLKYFLDRVITCLGNMIVWLKLVLLPICTLTLFQPRTSAEKKSGNRKRLQVMSINQALVV